MNSSRATATLDWTLLHSFLAVAEAGSLNRAAQALGVSQPTLSRQIAALEAALRTPLFERSARGLRLTAAAEALVEPARRMREQALAFALTAAGRSETLAGTVRLTASEMVSTYLLPGLLRELRDSHPEIQIELVASNELENLLERGADIAVRMVRPQQSGLIARKLVELPLIACASRDYVSRFGEPTLATMAQHQWVGYDRSDQVIRGFRAAGFDVGREFFAFRCDDQVVAWEAVRAGLGIGFTIEPVAQRSPEVVRVLREIALPPLPVWLTAHRELRGSARIRTVYEALAAAFQRLA